MGASGRTFKVPIKLMVWQAMRAVDQAIRTRQVFHMGLHPLDFSIFDYSGTLRSRLEEIVAHAAQAIQRSDLRNLTMGQLAQEVVK